MGTMLSVCKHNGRTWGGGGFTVLYSRRLFFSLPLVGAGGWRQASLPAAHAQNAFHILDFPDPTPTAPFRTPPPSHTHCPMQRNVGSRSWSVGPFCSTICPQFPPPQRLHMICLMKHTAPQACTAPPHVGVGPPSPHSVQSGPVSLAMWPPPSAADCPTWRRWFVSRRFTICQRGLASNRQQLLA